MTSIKIGSITIESDGDESRGDPSRGRTAIRLAIESLSILVKGAAFPPPAETAEPATQIEPMAPARVPTACVPAGPAVGELPAPETPRPERRRSAAAVPATPVPPAPVAPARVPAAPAGGGGKRVQFDERPGETFSVDEAAALAGVSRSAIYAASSPGAVRAGKNRAGGMTIRPAGAGGPPPQKNGEARPRSSGESQPRNAYVVGAASRIPQASERPTRIAAGQ